MMLGYDSMDGRQSANLLCNVFVDHHYVKGRLGAPDGYKRPFNSLDLIDSFDPTGNWTVKFKVQTSWMRPLRLSVSVWRPLPKTQVPLWS